MMFPLLVLLLLLPPRGAHAQDAPPAERGLYLGVFRSPSTGVEWRAGHLAVHAGFYPTILKADSMAAGRSTSFLRVGSTLYGAAGGRAIFVSPSLVLSLDAAWKSGLLSELGIRLPVGPRASLRLGAGLLTTFDGVIRLNPTVGLDIALGRPRPSR